MFRKSKLNLFTRVILAGVLFSISSANAQSGPGKFNVSGGLFHANGTAITNANVNFKVEIYDTGANCLLYSEQHLAEDLSVTKGGFSLEIGLGTSQTNPLEGTTAFSSKIFQNPGVVGPFTGCAGGVTLASGSDRLIRVSYDLGSGYVAMTPDVPITSAPYAMVAETLQGKSATDFILTNVNTQLSQNSMEYLFTNTNYANLKALVDGTSSQYMVTSPSADVSFNSNKIVNVADPTAPQDAATKNYSDGNIGGQPVDMTGIAPGVGGNSVLAWDQVQNKWVARSYGSVSSITAGTGLTGGTIVSAGTLSVDVGTTANKILQLNGSAQIPAVNGSLLTNVNAVQLWSRNVSSAAPSSGQVLTWNMTASEWEASTPSGGTITALTGDVTASGSGSVVATISADAITSAKINSTGIAKNLLLITDSTTGVGVGYMSCSLGQVLQWDANGWGCVDMSMAMGPSGVAAGTYGSDTMVPRVTVDAQGRVTALSNVNIAFPVTTVAGRTGAVTLIASDIGGLGTAALVNIGTASSNVPQLDAFGRMPAVDGSQLTNLTAGSVSGVATGTGLVGGTITTYGTLSVDVGTTGNKIMQLTAGAQIPAVDGNLVTNINAVKLQARNVAATAPAGGQVLGWNASASEWQPLSVTSGTVTSVGTGTGLLGGPITNNGTLSVDVGTGANQIVQLDGSSKLPGVDGSALTNLNATRIGTRSIATTAPAPGQYIGWNNSTSQWEPMATTVGTVTNVATGNGLLGGPITNNGTLSVDTGTTGNKILQLTAGAQIPAVDGNLVTNINAVKLQARNVSASAPGGGQVLGWNAATSVWEPIFVTNGTVIQISSGTGLLGGPISSFGTLSVDVGTGANQIVQLDGSSKLPAVDGSALSNLNATRIGTRTVANSAPGVGQILSWNNSTSQWEPMAPATSGTVTNVATGNGLLGGPISSNGTLSVDTGTTGNKILQLTAGAQIPAVDGNLVTNVNAVKLQARNVSASAPTSGQVLGWNGLNSQWEPLSAAVGSVTSVQTGVGMVGGPITSSGTVSVDVGTTGNKILQLTAGAQIPAVDGNLVTNVNAVKLQARDVAATAPGGGQVLSWNSSSSVWEPRSVTSGTVTTVNSGTGLLGGPITNNGTLSVDVGTGANQIVQLDASSKLPAVDGYALTNLNATRIGTRTVASTAPGVGQVLSWNNSTSQWEPMAPATSGTVTNVATGSGLVGGPISNTGTLSVDVGTTSGKIMQLTAAAQIPAVDGNLVTNVNAVKLQARNVAATAPSSGQVLGWNGLSGVWEPMSTAVGSVTNVATGAGLLGGPISSSGTLSVDVGVGANQIVQLDASSKLPAVDGYALSNLNATRIGTRTIATTAPGAGQFVGWNNLSSQWEPMAVTTGTVTNVATGIGLSGGPISSTGTISVDVGTTSGKIMQLTAAAQIPAVDGNLVTNVNAVKLQSRNVAATAPTGGQVLGWNGLSGVWEPMSTAVGSVTNVATGTGLLGGPISSSGTLSVNVGTGANQIVQLDASSKLPAVDGYALSNLNATRIGTRTIATTAPGAGQVLSWNNLNSQWEPMAPASSGTVTNVATGAGLTGGPISSTGTISVDVGTTSGKIMQLTASAQIPAVDGNLVTNINAVKLQTRNVAATAPTGGQVLGWNSTSSIWEPSSVTSGTVTNVATGTGLSGGPISSTGTISVDVGTTSGKIMQLTASAQIPAVDGNLVTNINAVKLQARDVASTAPTSGQVLGWNGNNGKWEPMSTAVGSVTNVQAGAGLTGGPITSSGTLSVDVGTTSGKILQLTGAAQIPAVDGNLVTNINAVKLQARNVAATAPTGGQVLGWNALNSVWEPSSVSSGTVMNVATGTGLSGGPITSSGTLSVDVGTTSGKILQLTGAAQIPAVDGNLVTNINAVKLQARNVAATAPTGGQVLGWNAATSVWEPSSSTSGTVTTVTSGTGLVGGPITNSGTLSVDVGTTSNKILQLTAAAQIPAVDGNLVTNINAVKLQTRDVASTAPTSGQVLGWNGNNGKWEPMSTAVGSVTNVATGAGLTGGPISSSGTISVDVGTTSGKILQLNASAQIPAVDGNLVTNINAVKLQARNVAATAPTGGQVLVWNALNSVWEPSSVSSGTVTNVATGTGLSGGPISNSGTISVDVGTTSGKILQLTASAQIPAVDGNLVTNVNAVKLQTRDVASTAPTSGQVLGWNGNNGKWEPMSTAVGSVTNVATGAGLAGGPITSSGTLSVDVGTTSGKILQLTGAAQIPAVDGNLVTNVNAVKLQTRDVASTAPTSGQVLGWNGNNGKWEPMSTAVGSVTNVATGTGLTGGPISSSGTISVDVGTTSGKILQLNANAQIPAVDGYLIANVNAYRNGGNYHGANATLGTKDAFNLALITNDLARLTITGSGAIGVGTASPQALLDLSTTTSGQSAIIVPRDIASNRPATGVNGMIRYNTSTSKFEAFENNSWVNMTPAGSGLASAGNSGALQFSNGSGGFVSNNNVVVSSSTGNLGVGTTTPTNLLHVEQNANAATRVHIGNPSTGTGVFAEFRGNTNAGDMKIGVGSLANNFALGGAGKSYWAGPSDLQFAPGGAGVERMRIDSSGNVGIGTASPTVALNIGGLDVSGGTKTGIRLDSSGGTSNPALKITLDDTNNMVWFQGANSTPKLAFGNNTTAKMVIDNLSGNVGIGTSIPQAILDVATTTSGQSAIIVPRDTTANRPLTGVNGMIRYNTSTSVLESFANGTWTSLAGAGASYLPLTGGTMTGPILQAGGTAANAAYSFSSDPNTGMYSSAVDNLQFTTNGVQRLLIDQLGNVAVGTTSGLMVRTNGYVGVGTPTPQATLDIGGTLRLSATGTSDQIVLKVGSLAAGARFLSIYEGANLRGGFTGNATSWGMTSGNQGNVWLGTKETGAGDPSGGYVYGNNTTSNIGIGTMTPRVALEITSTTTSNSALIIPRDIAANRPTGVNGMIRYNTSTSKFEAFENNAWVNMTPTGAGLASSGNSGALQYSNGSGGFLSNNNLVIDGTNGYIGIGVASPDRALHVASATSAPQVHIARTDASPMNMWLGGYNQYAGIAADQPIQFRVSSTNGSDGVSAMHITSTGDVGIGTTTPVGAALTIAKSVQRDDDMGAALDIPADGVNYPSVFFSNQTTSSYGGLLWTTSTSGNDPTKIGAYIGPLPTSATNFDLQFYTNNAIGTTGYRERMRITGSGNVGIGTASPQAILDVATTTSGQSAIIVPRDTAANRPPTGVNGMIRYNTNTAAFEGFANGTWGALGTSGSPSFPLLASPIGTAANAAYSFTSDPNTGMYSDSADKLNFSTNGVQRIAIDQLGNVALGTSSALFVSASGNVGIGTLSTNSPLTVAGVGGTNVPILRLANTATGPTNLQIDGFAGAGNYVGRRANGNWTAPSALASGDHIIQIGGRGYGATGYSGSSRAIIGITTSEAWTDTEQGAYIWFHTTATGSVNTTEKMRIDPSGNVGIGTASPQALLDLSTTASGWSAVIVPRDTTAKRPSTGVNGMIRYNTNTAAFEGFANGNWGSLAGSSGTSSGNSGALQFSDGAGGFLSNNNVVVNSSSGNVGIGSVTPAFPLDVFGQGRIVGSGTAPTLRVQTSSSADETIAMWRSANTSPLTISYQPAGSITGSNKQWFTGLPANSNTFMIGAGTGGSGTPYLQIDNNGNVGIGTGSPQALLDLYTLGSGRSAIIVPRDTTANRPPTGVNGMIRYNTSTSVLESFVNGSWTSLAGSGTGSSGTTGAIQLSNGSGGFVSNNNISVNSSTGYVGIGTSAAENQLHIFSSANSLQTPIRLQNADGSSSGTAVGLLFKGGTSGGAKGGIAFERTASWGLGKMHFMMNGTGDTSDAALADAKVTISEYGNVGIGTISPSAALHVFSGNAGSLIVDRGASNNSASMEFRNSIGSMYAGINSSGNFAAASSSNLNAADFNVTTAGYVGIGTLSPQAALDVVNTASGWSAIIIPRDTTAKRPPTGVNGMIRYNTNLAAFEGFANGAWGSLASGGGSASGNSGALQMSNGSGGFTSNNNIKIDPTTGFVGIGTASAGDFVSIYSPSAAGPAMTLATIGTGTGQQVMLNLATKSNSTSAFGVAGATTKGWQIFGNSDNYTGSKQNYFGLTYWDGTNWNPAYDIDPSGTVEFNRWGSSSANVVVNAYNNTGNTIIEALRLKREDGDSAAATGAGTAMTFSLETTVDGTFAESGRIASVWDDAANNSKDSSMRFYTLGPNAGTGTTSPSERLRIDSSGDVGIGTGTPQAILDVYTTVSGASAIIVPRDTAAKRPPTGVNGMIRYNTNSSALEAFTNGSWSSLSGGASATGASGAIQYTDGSGGLLSNNNIFIDGTNGRVGIGITSPLRPLTIGGYDTGTTIDSSRTATIRIMEKSATVGGISGIQMGGSNQGDQSIQAAIYTVRTSAGGNGLSDLLFATHSSTADSNVSEKFRLTGPGNVGIGTPTPRTILEVTTTTSGMSAIIVPRDTTANRPPTGVNGMIRYNSSTSKLEAFQNNAWVDMIGGGLTNFVESVNTAAPNATTPVVNLTPNNAATDVDLALTPKGSGALTAQVATGSAVGGNKRGLFAVDWQMGRTTAAQVASGLISTISGGEQNTASGNDSTVAGGVLNTASGGASTVIGGSSNTASGDSSLAANFQTTSESFAQSTFGQYNVLTGGNANVWTATDPVFVVGIGTSSAARSNALTILKNGNVGIGTTTPGASLHVTSTVLNAATIGSSNADTRFTVESMAAASTSNSAGLQLNVNSSNQNRNVAFLKAFFTDTNDATRTSKFQILTKNNGSTLDAFTIDGINVGIGTASPLTRLHTVSTVAPATTYAADASTSRFPSGNSVVYLRQVAPADDQFAGMALQLSNAATSTQAAYIGAISASTGGNRAAIVMGQSLSGSSFTERMRIDPAGNVGIGTPTPRTILEVTTTTSGMSAIIVPRDTTVNRPPTGVNGMIRYNSNTSKLEAFENDAWVNMTPSGAGVSSAGSSGAIQFSNGSGGLLSNNNIVVNSSNGRVGIGTPTPTGPFQVEGGTAASASPGASITLTGQNAGAGNLDGGQIVLVPGAASGSGNDGFVYIGGRNNTAALQVYSPIGTTPSIAVTNGTNTGYARLSYQGNSRSYSTGVGNGSETTFGVANKWFLFDDTATAIRMTVDTSGNVGIGTTTPGSGTKLYVNGQVATKSSSISTAAIDFSAGNAVSTSFNCSTNLSLANIRDGGSYTVVVTHNSTTQCNFGTAVTGDDAATVTYRFNPANGTRAGSSTHTIYSLLRVGTVVYVSWITGF